MIIFTQTRIRSNQIAAKILLCIVGQLFKRM
uniref:Uncharacterized protein n=1 Tax=Arundo donax TaxID=35708 RepID=A0A0A9BGT6_ARUDO